MKGFFTKGVLVGMLISTLAINAYYSHQQKKRQVILIDALKEKSYELHSNLSILRAYQVFNDEDVKPQIIKVKFDDEFSEGDIFRAYPITYKGETMIVFIVEGKED